MDNTPFNLHVANREQLMPDSPNDRRAHKFKCMLHTVPHEVLQSPRQPEQVGFAWEGMVKVVDVRLVVGRFYSTVNPLRQRRADRHPFCRCRHTYKRQFSLLMLASCDEQGSKTHPRPNQSKFGPIEGLHPVQLIILNHSCRRQPPLRNCRALDTCLHKPVAGLSWPVRTSNESAPRNLFSYGPPRYRTQSRKSNIKKVCNSCINNNTVAKEHHSHEGKLYNRPLIEEDESRLQVSVKYTENLEKLHHSI